MFGVYFYFMNLRAETTTKSRPFYTENNTKTISKQLENKFEKVQKTTFWNHKTVTMTLCKAKSWPKSSPKSQLSGSISPEN